MPILSCLAPAILLSGGATAVDLPRPMTFVDETATRVVMSVSEGSSNEKEVEVGDIDQDGDLDVVIAVGAGDFGERRNKLYRNDGGVLTEISSFIPEFSMGDVSRNAFLRDFDGDGWLDIYIINDSNSGGFAGNDHVYIAQVVGGSLVGYSEEGQTRIASGGSLGAACGGISADLDQDGDADVYSGNYPGPSQDVGLYNNGSGTLANMTGSLVPSDSDYTVDVASADMNGDGKIDLLVSNWSDNYLYYNDKLGAGSGVGDFDYPGSVQNLGDATVSENAMEPADFDGDGDMDVYWSGRGPGSDLDRVLVNTGNDASNRAIFETIDPVPGSVTGASRKASVGDLNGDGRPDVFVANQTGGRPTILRNTSVEGTISFVDWTPRSAISGSPNMQGWHAGVFDADGDGDLDILVGAFNGDFLLDNADAAISDEDDLAGGVLPALWNVDPVAVRGRADVGASDTFSVADAGNGFLSIALNGPDDYRLELLAVDGQTVLQTVDRGGLGVEEATQVNTSGARFLRVTVLESAGGGCTDPADLDGDCSVGLSDVLAVLSAWGCTGCAEDFVNPGNGAGLEEILAILAAWGTAEPADADYQLEVLGRS